MACFNILHLYFSEYNDETARNTWIFTFHPPKNTFCAWQLLCYQILQSTFSRNILRSTIRPMSQKRNGSEKHIIAFHSQLSIVCRSLLFLSIRTKIWQLNSRLFNLLKKKKKERKNEKPKTRKSGVSPNWKPKTWLWNHFSMLRWTPKETKSTRSSRDAVFRFRYTYEGLVQRAPKARASRRVWWHSPPENVYF